MSTLIRPELAQAFDKLPPHSVEAEMCLVGSLAICGNDPALFAQVRAVVTPESFYQADHAVIFETICKLYDAGVKVDSVTLMETMKRRQLWEECGGAEYLGKILNKVPSYAHAEHYARIVADKAKWREVIRISNEAIRAAYAPHDDYEFEAVDKCLGDLAAKSAQIATGGKAASVYRVSDVLPEILQSRHNQESRRVPTGIASLDQIIGGLTFGEKIIIGGKPSMGKSATIKKLARNLAGQGIKSGIVSVEEKRQKITTNLLSGESQIPNNRIEFGTATEQDWNEIELAAEKLAAIDLFMVDSARKISAILAMVNVLVSQHGCQAIFVDHLHIIDGEPGRHENRNLEISKISAELKWAWKDLNVIGVEAAQLNRGGGKERPTLDSLRDSGSLEQDADTVILLHREDYYRRAELGYQPDRILELLVLKNKHGATATIPVHYDEARYLIRDLESEPPRDPWGDYSPDRPKPKAPRAATTLDDVEFPE